MELRHIRRYLKENSFPIDEQNWKKFSELFRDVKNQIEKISISYEELMKQILKENDKKFFQKRENIELMIDSFIIRDGEIESIEKFYSQSKTIFCFKNDRADGRSWDVYFYDPEFR